MSENDILKDCHLTQRFKASRSVHDFMHHGEPLTVNTKAEETMKQMINYQKTGITMKLAEISIASAALAVALALTGWSSTAAAEEPIKVGLVLPFKGVYANLAENFASGWDIALDQYNGEIAGRKIKVFREDTEANPNVAVQRATKLMNAENVDVLAGVVSSGVGVALGQFANQQKVPIVLGMAIADVITGKNCGPYVIRTSFSAHSLTSGFGRYLANSYKTASTLGPDYAAGHAMIGGFNAGFRGDGGEIKGEHWSAFKQTKDWGPILGKIQSEKPDAVYSFYAGSESVQVVKQYANFGLKDSIPLYGDHWLYDESLWDAMGDAAVGGRFVTTNALDVDNEANHLFIKAFKKKYGKTPDINAYLGYENALPLFKAIEALGGDVTDSAKLVKTMRGLEFDAPRGRYTFNNDNNAVLDKVYVIEIVRDGDKLKPKLIDSIAGGSDLSGCNM
ncbi:ABC transporter substrate-binding protein [Oceanospirillaceae bacterium]|jgi:branched-chain amino acid transport system substrate-binding protein|nr:ABC transporter substrate-binding protein [Oceanospirillaceae bacterium]|tara:strand:+ start:187 stop:1536 length:1350 start_codon:yes stop_codon:yes gene_type:complete